MIFELKCVIIKENVMAKVFMQIIVSQLMVALIGFLEAAPTLDHIIAYHSPGARPLE